LSPFRLQHFEQTSHSRQSGTANISTVPLGNLSAGSGSTWCWQTLHHTTSRTRACAALPERHRRTRVGITSLIDSDAWRPTQVAWGGEPTFADPIVNGQVAP
jgi:hypothetical protein